MEDGEIAAFVGEAWSVSAGFAVNFFHNFHIHGARKELNRFILESELEATFSVDAVSLLLQGSNIDKDVSQLHVMFIVLP